MNDRACSFCTQLANLHQLPDDEVVWQFDHSVALLGPWQYYHGYCILVARQHAAELNQLADSPRRAYFEEMCRLARAIEDVCRPHKLNYELLGNQVPHLHWHLFPRYLNDPERLQPVWLALARADHDPAEKERLRAGWQSRAATAGALRRHLQSLNACPS